MFTFKYKPEEVDFMNWSFWRKMFCLNKMNRGHNMSVSDENSMDTGYCLDRFIKGE